MKVGIIGSGSWGSAFGHHLCKLGHQVVIYGREKHQIDYVAKTHENPHYLPGVRLCKDIVWTYCLEDLQEAPVLIIAISAQGIREFLKENKELFKGKLVVNLSKGIDHETLMRISEMVDTYCESTYFCISGPSHAEEVAIDVPTAVVIAGEDEKLARMLQKEFSSNSFRIYYSRDLKGVEMAAAFKNVLAIIIGLSDGLGFGDNTKAAIMTRGIHEIMKLSLAYGSEKETFLGLSGYGDIIVTCTSVHSRNRRWGEYIARGMSPQEASDKVGMVVEGVATLEAALKLAKRKNIEMPLFENLYQVLYQGKLPKETVRELMNREYKEEWYEENN